MKTSLPPFLRRFVPFHGTPSIVSDALQALLGTTEDGGKKKKKVYKIFKSTETSPIARGNKFPLTFYFRFVRNARSRTERCTNERWAGTKKKKLQKEEGGGDVR
jgi:hypothetical protein